jgi:hypothetical protein
MRFGTFSFDFMLKKHFMKAGKAAMFHILTLHGWNNPEAATNSVSGPQRLP